MGLAPTQRTGETGAARRGEEDRLGSEERRGQGRASCFTMADVSGEASLYVRTPIVQAAGWARTGAFGGVAAGTK